MRWTLSVGRWAFSPKNPESKPPLTRISLLKNAYENIVPNKRWLPGVCLGRILPNAFTCHVDQPGFDGCYVAFGFANR